MILKVEIHQILPCKNLFSQILNFANISVNFELHKFNPEDIEIEENFTEIFIISQLMPNMVGLLLDFLDDIKNLLIHSRHLLVIERTQ